MRPEYQQNMSRLPSNIKAVIFDLGNVLIDLDYPKCIAAFSNAANRNKEAIEELVVTAPMLQEFEVGKITPEDFQRNINELLGSELSMAQLEKVWNSMLKSVGVERLELIADMRATYQTYVLSNTNSIHKEAFEQMVLEATGADGIGAYFDKVYLSHEIGYRKPNSDCYEYVISDIGLKPEEMLFLDDRLDNIEAAWACGIKAIQIEDADQQLKELLKN